MQGAGNKVVGKPDGNPSTPLAGARTGYAKYRTSLALDRTTLAWIRTAMTFATFGFGMVAFFLAIALQTHSDQAVRLH